MAVNFGYAGLNQNLNQNSNNSFNTNTAQGLSNLLTPVRVIDIILDESHPLFEFYGEWNSLGIIKYEIVSTGAYAFLKKATAGFTFDKTSPYAYPAAPNIKNYPLINEIVYILSLPNPGIGENPDSSVSYYLNLTALWNHPHHNAYPSNANEAPAPQQKNYLQTIAGSVVATSTNPTQVFLGKTFKERSNIHPLRPFEGDVIHEGRGGNSIRLGSTVKGTPNNWSSAGDDGDPITIIRNGQGKQTDEGWIPIVENINESNSSIYLTSTQNIPLNVFSANYASYPDGQQPTSTNKYAGAQIILDSGRLVFNASDDHILFSSALSINLNSRETVNIDTKKFITNADKIFLGKEDLATEPLLLGDTTAQVLRDLVYALKEAVQSLQFLISDPVAPGAPATFTSLQIPMTNAISCLQGLEKQLGSSSEDCTLTSKRNFTL